MSTVKYLEEAAKFCEQRPEPVQSIELVVDKLGIRLRWQQIINKNVFGMSKIVSYAELDQCPQNPIILTAKNMEEEIKHHILKEREKWQKKK